MRNRNRPEPWRRNAIVVLCALAFWFVLVRLHVLVEMMWLVVPVLVLATIHAAAMYRLLSGNPLAKIFAIAAVPSIPLAIEWLGLPRANPRALLEISLLSSATLCVYACTGVVALIEFVRWLRNERPRRAALVESVPTEH